MIKAVIFDFDGTLMNTIPTIAKYCDAALKYVGLPAIADEAKYKSYVGNGRDDLMHTILGYCNADTPENYENAGREYDRLYSADMLSGSYVYDGIWELLDNLKKEGIKVAVCSNKPHDIASGMVAEVFGDTFDECFGKRDGVPRKPAPDSAFEIAKKLGVEPNECAFVGDTLTDVKTGENAGMFTIAVSWGFRDRDSLKSADVLADAPCEIFDAIKNKNRE